ncbi:signal peptidase I [Aphanomyces invadans]|uniref:Signal peptidase I n=1 Tax=Aphanomyces invadans TaxID=157072 RepID=A0A024TLC7_9STRA|nr:signal peptidase I [Aphanomyces invadans]ETV94838.1 signal peptidase I [Aphanomyces invadans]|eukprot:XP_008876429.1 signal peptidase I [Aphanomyces invadans]
MEQWAIKTVRVVAAAVCVKLYVGDVLLGMGPSMQPTVPDGVIILVDKLSLRWKPPTVGDVVVISSPVRAQGSMCKRIIAMEGQFVKRRPRFEADAEEIVEVAIVLPTFA